MKFTVCKTFAPVRIDTDQILNVLKHVLLLTGATGHIRTEVRYLSQTTSTNLNHKCRRGYSYLPVESDIVWQFAATFRDSNHNQIWIKILWMSAGILKIDLTTVTKKQSKEVLQLIKDKLKLTDTGQ